MRITTMRGSSLDIQASLLNAIDSYLVWALLSTFLCCSPLGLLAVYYAAQVNQLKEEEDVSGALEASRKARKWCRAAVLAQLILFLLYGLIVLAGTLARRFLASPFPLP